MKCHECPDRRFHRDKIERTKYITRAECKLAGNHGLITVELGGHYVGKTFRVVIEEIPCNHDTMNREASLQIADSVEGKDVSHVQVKQNGSIRNNSPTGRNR